MEVLIRQSTRVARDIALLPITPVSQPSASYLNTVAQDALPVARLVMSPHPTYTLSRL